MLPSRRQQHSGSVVVHSPLLKSVAAADGPGTEASPQKKTKGRNILVATLGPDNARLLSGTCAFNDRPAWNFPSPIRFVGVVTVAVLLFGLVRWGCAHTAASCSALPLWASGLSWIPFDDESAVTEPSGSAIERFDFKYHCTPNASDPYHRPRLLFDPPVLLDGTTALPADDERRLDLLVGILSACKSSETRDVVRQTWQRCVWSPEAAPAAASMQ